MGWCLASVALVAQEPAHSGGVPYVRASGESVVEVKPDQASITVAVVTQASTASAAASQNATQVTAVLDRLRKESGPNADIRTVGYSVNPNYTYPNQPNSTGPKIVGYTASNTVQIKLDDIAMVGRVLDAATAVGANNVHGVQFSVKDERAVRAQALRQASQNARAAAEAMAAALGLRVVRVRSAETGEPSIVRPVQELAMARMAADRAAPTPVEPGNVQVRGVVTVTLDVAP